MKKILILILLSIACLSNAQIDTTRFAPVSLTITNPAATAKIKDANRQQNANDSILRYLIWQKGTGGSGSMTWPFLPGIPIYSGNNSWSSSITNNSTNWNTAYSNRISTFTTTGSSGAATFTSNTLNIPNYTLSGLGGQPSATILTTFSNLANSTGYLYNNGSGTLSYSAGGATDTMGLHNQIVALRTRVDSLEAFIDSIPYTILLDTASIGISGGTGSITLTTEGTSGVATLSNNILNVPNYQFVGSGNVDTTFAVWPDLYTGTRTQRFTKALTIAEATKRKLLIDTITLVGGIGLNLTNYGVEIEGKGNGSFIKSATGTDIVIQFSSVRSTAVTIASDIALNSNTIVLSDADATIQAGDLLQIVSTLIWGGTSYYQGEVVKVQSVSSATITLTDRVHMLFPTASTTIRKMNSKPVTIEGITFENVSIETYYCRDIGVSNCHWTNRLEALDISLAYDAMVQNCTANKTSGSFNYGFVFYSCINATIKDCPDISYFDQAIISGAANNCGPCINIKYINNKCTVFASTGGVIDLHPCIDPEVRDNYVRTTGIAYFIKGLNINFTGNTAELYGTSARGVQWEREYTNAVARGEYHHNYYSNIKNNTITKMAATYGAMGINVSFMSIGDSTDILDMSGNVVNVAGTALRIVDDEGINNYIKYFKLDGNTFLSSGGRAVENLSICQIDKIVSSNNVYHGNYADDVTFYFSTATNFKDIISTNDYFRSDTINFLGKGCSINGKSNSSVTMNSVTTENGKLDFVNVPTVKLEGVTAKRSIYGAFGFTGCTYTSISKLLTEFSTSYYTPYLINAVSNVDLYKKTVATPATIGTQTLDVIDNRSIQTEMYTITPTGNCTFNIEDNETNATEGVLGKTLTFRVLTSGTNSYDLTFGTHFKPSAVLATGVTTAKKFIITFTFDGTDWVESFRSAAL
jgi:hypothetical protein